MYVFRWRNAHSSARLCQIAEQMLCAASAGAAGCGWVRLGATGATGCDGCEESEGGM